MCSGPRLAAVYPLDPIRLPVLKKFPELLHGVFGRKGGHSEGPFSGLNVGLGVGDDTDRVLKNRHLIQAAMGGRPLVFTRQVHGAQVVILKKEEDVGAIPGRPVIGDALVTDIPGVLLAIQVADCQAVMVYSPDRRVVANIHSGWRGSISNIIGRTIRVMTDAFGCDPGQMVAGVGPSLGPCCAEFIHYKNEIPEQYWGYKDHRNYFDFWRMSRDQLQTAGIPENRISVSGLCTRCRSDLFFSYRGEKKTGRFAAVIGVQAE